MRQQFSETVYETLREDKDAIVLIGDISHYLLSKTEKYFPDRFYNAGICEQSLIGVSAGLSMSGMKPIVHTIAPFSVERSFEQIKIDLSYQNTSVTIVSVGSSFDYASLGCTHHCYEDISLMRTLPNMQVFVPGNSKEFDNLFKKTWNEPGSKYFKLSSKENNQKILCDPYQLVKVKDSSSNKIVIVTGHLIDEVLESDVDCTVLYTPSLSYLNNQSVSLLTSEILNKEEVYTIEENSIIGGLGDFIFNILSESQGKIPPFFRKIGIPLTWLTKYGTAKEHRENLGLTIHGIRSILEKK